MKERKKKRREEKKNQKGKRREGEEEEAGGEEEEAGGEEEEAGGEEEEAGGEEEEAGGEEEPEEEHDVVPLGKKPEGEDAKGLLTTWIGVVTDPKASNYHVYGSGARGLTTEGWMRSALHGQSTPVVELLSKASAKEKGKETDDDKDDDDDDDDT